MSFVKNIASSVQRLVANAIDTIHWRKNKWTPQVRASIQPYASCFGHSVAWFLQNLGIKITPDEVMREVNNNHWYQEAVRVVGTRIANQFRGKLNQLWDVMKVYTNKKISESNIQRKITVTFSRNLTDDKILRSLRVAPVICSIAPRFKGRILGHVVLIVGRKGDSWIVDDPYGDFTKEYPCHLTGGDDIVIKKKKFRKYLSGYFINAIR